MKEYNELTKELLAAGYTAANYPTEKYHIESYRVHQENPLDNIYGGFKYNTSEIKEMVYVTGCGKMTKNVINNMGYKGIEWCHENNNPVIRCPYDKAECENNNKLLHGTHGGGLCIQCFCECHRTNEEYLYENSIEKAEAERQQEKERKYQEYAAAQNGRVCRNQMFYDERTREWHLHYNPENCLNFCPNQYKHCTVLDKDLSKKRGNVYYDIKESTIRNDGTVFQGEEIVSILKGNRVFDHPVSIDICEAYVKVNKDKDIDFKFKWNTSSRKSMFDKNYRYEILNVRAMAKASRDLLQDLDDIKNGATIIHASDVMKKLRSRKGNEENWQK